jgi:hypothetical protein
MKDTKISRPLTAGEIALSKTMFKDAINYAKVKVNQGSYFPFGLQDKNTAVTPNGELYFVGDRFSQDFSVDDKYEQHWFIHEMVHVWQYQLGMNVKLRGVKRCYELVCRLQIFITQL